MPGHTYCSPRLRRPWAAARPGRTLQQDTKPLLPGGRRWNLMDYWAWPRRPWAAARPGRASRSITPIPCCPEGTSGTGGTAGSDCGAHGQRQGLAGLRDDAPIPCCLEGTSGTGGTAGPGCGARGRRQGLAEHSSRTRSPCCLEGAGGTTWTTEPGCGARGRRQGLAGLRDRPLRAAGSRVAISRAGRRPRAPTSRQALTAWRPRS